MMTAAMEMNAQTRKTACMVRSDIFLFKDIPRFFC